MKDETTLRFPARDLKPYAEYVRSKELVLGDLYFRVHFLDSDMLVPELVPLVFIGRNLTPGDDARGSSVLYFQHFESHSAGIRYEPVGGDAEAGAGDATVEHDAESPSFECSEETEFSGALEFEKAPDVLLDCSLRRSRPTRSRADRLPCSSSGRRGPPS